MQHPLQTRCPDAAGAYVLVVSLPAPLAIRLGSTAPSRLPAGRYLYCGSAYGPGGLWARLTRHFRTDKTIRWHIDQLTTQGMVLGAWALAGGHECDCVRRLGFLSAPIDGFGASDCTQCRSHLLRWPRRVTRKRLLSALSEADAAPLWLPAARS